MLLSLGLATSREKARRLIMAGEVRVNGVTIDKPGAQVRDDAEVSVEKEPPYVSRGGLKLEKALDLYGIRAEGCVVADIGASTGGFTDLWLQRGATRVYAIDVGYGQLAWKLRQDARVVVMERTNARYLESLPEPVQRVSVDVSFISLDLILPRAYGWLSDGGEAVVLIKPQFEAGADRVGKGGVVRDLDTHRDVIARVLMGATGSGWQVLGVTRSPLVGPAGNVEFLAWLGRNTTHDVIGSGTAIDDAISRTLQ
ncbi:MAG: TlyA family RNA methyltransferase [Anaerolineae bacterium]